MIGRNGVEEDPCGRIVVLGDLRLRKSWSWIFIPCDNSGRGLKFMLIFLRKVGSFTLQRQFWCLLKIGFGFDSIFIEDRVLIYYLREKSCADLLQAKLA